MLQEVLVLSVGGSANSRSFYVHEYLYIGESLGVCTLLRLLVTANVLSSPVLVTL
jgi:hypothetical protein